MNVAVFAEKRRHQLPGLRGIACVANVGHGALMAVRHMFPAKLLLLPAGD